MWRCSSWNKVSCPWNSVSCSTTQSQNSGRQGRQFFVAIYNMESVLISHTKAEAPLARRLAKSLKERGYETWSQLDITVGAAWHIEVERAIEQAFGAIFLFSSNRISSKFMLLEFESVIYNRRFHGRVLPVVVNKHRSTPSVEAPWIFESLSEVQVLNVDVRNGFAKAADDIASAFMKLTDAKGQI